MLIDEYLDEEKQTVIMLSASWCGSCRAVTPTFNKMAEKYKDQVKFVKLDVDDCQDLADELNVKGLPAVFFYRNGQLQNSMGGMISAGKFEELIDTREFSNL